MLPERVPRFIGTLLCRVGCHDPTTDYRGTGSCTEERVCTRCSRLLAILPPRHRYGAWRFEVEDAGQSGERRCQTSRHCLRCPERERAQHIYVHHCERCQAAAPGGPDAYDADMHSWGAHVQDKDTMTLRR